MSKRILFLSKGANASSTRYRALQYFSLFGANGYEPKHVAITGGVLPFIRALYAATYSDIVVLVRKTLPAPLFWLLRVFSKKMVFDFDDAIFSNSNGSHSSTRTSRFHNTVKHCDFVFAGNSYLANEAKRTQTNTAVIPTSLDSSKYLKVDKPKGQFVLVWIGSRSTQKYIEQILPAIELAAQSVPNLQLKIIADFTLQSSKVSINNIAWSESTEAYEVASSNIGLAPLTEDNWTRGKCALKVLQYMATHLPVISSPTGVNGYVVESEKNGYIAETQEDWENAIKIAYKEKVKLDQMGQNAKRRVDQEFDINVIFKKIINILEKV